VITAKAADKEQSRNVLAAAAACWSLGLTPELIQAGLVGFEREMIDPSVAPA